MRADADFIIHSSSDLSSLVDDIGFLPLLKNSIPGFSVEEHTPSELWFVDGVEGPWEWKGPVIQETGCAYGKFFSGKAGFISRRWFPDFANYRRDGYDFDARCDDGLARHQDKVVYDILLEYHSLISREWRMLSPFTKRSEFDAIVSHLQMLCYVTTVDFEYPVDRNGNAYGWGLARYETPEEHFGSAFTDHVYSVKPEESEKRIASYLKTIVPEINEKQIRKITG